jgi:phycoerythrobilin:ferredoxin oxidoreductase
MTLYEPFLDTAIATLKAQLRDFAPYPIPAGFESKSGVMGGKQAAPVLTTSYGFQSGKLRQIRAAHVQGGAALQVLNFVIFPHLNYDLPFFGADLVTLPGGHLIALDLQPLFRDDPAYQAKYAEPADAHIPAVSGRSALGRRLPRRGPGLFLPGFFMDSADGHRGGGNPCDGGV